MLIIWWSWRCAISNSAAQELPSGSSLHHAPTNASQPQTEHMGLLCRPVPGRLGTPKTTNLAGAGGCSLWLSKLRIPYSHCCGQGHCCGMGLILDPGTSTCHACSQNKQTKKATLAQRLPADLAQTLLDLHGPLWPSPHPPPPTPRPPSFRFLPFTDARPALRSRGSPFLLWPPPLYYPQLFLS